ncbi:hypothetical protein [Arthrobacter sp. GAS37]|uniref:hypothetical protein n=1 Tax=Arthrobacter sp. GAS37 TaxID=3156261 RepID=UPI003850859D
MAAVAALFGSFLAVLPASADGTTCDNRGVCSIEIQKPGTGGGGGSTGSVSADPVSGLTPGPTTCKDGDRDIPCQKDGFSWDPGASCYWKLSDPQKDPPAGESASSGAWYECWSSACVIGAPQPGNPGSITFERPGVCTIPSRWLGTPPPGVNKLTPAQAAAALIKSFQLKGIEIGIVPYDKPGYAGSVGLPVWMWAKNPQPLTTGPYTKSATLGGVTITATAKAAGTSWNMGDGQIVNCPGTGTPWDGTVNSSPDCGYRYSKQSAGQPNDSYTITATTQWVVDWNGGGQSGQIPLQTSSSTQIRIGEIQTIIR